MNAFLVFWFPWFVLVVVVVFWAYGLVDFLNTDERDIRTFTRPVWLAILVFGSAVGAIAWLVAGRPRRQ
ncbi:PLDc N-terminal domain-containing protein [Pseudarthrobacter sp. TAF60_1]|uniref:PLDc N-terminal domain-containing protein n=1 Tax=Pseudarthrobacter sp. TAF60_1 TaxID=3233071 RepID=UPI003F9AEDBE